MSALGTSSPLVGAGISVYGDITSADDQNQLDQEKAQVAQEQAAEIAQRTQANEQLTDQQAFRQQLQFGSAYAASGKEGVGIGGQLQIANQANTQNMIAAQEASFQEQMLNMQATMDTQQGQNLMSALPWAIAGSVVSGTGSAAGAYGNAQALANSGTKGQSAGEMPAAGEGAPAAETGLGAGSQVAMLGG